MTQSTKYLVVYALGASMAFLALALFFAQATHASAPPGLPATIATSSSVIVTTGSVSVLIATSSCAARIVSTGSTSAMLTFNDAQIPTGLFGTFQAGSTTKEYDSGQYGCGQIKAFSFGSGLVTVIDSR